MEITEFETFRKYIESQFLDVEKLKEKLLRDKYLIIICGPTGTGKSRAALYISKLFETHIISVDSMQAYKRMDIGTDKMDYKRYGVFQYMTDICEPDYCLTSAEYRRKTREVIEEEFFKKGIIPVLAGGSGLHIRAITEDLMHAPGTDFILRKKYKEDIRKKGISYLYEKLRKKDVLYADKISINDERRIIRALEVIEKSKMKYSDFQDKWSERKSIYNCVFIGLNMNRQKLYASVEKRIDLMMQKGLLQEVKDLLKNGFEESMSLKQAIGYKELVKHINCEKSLEEALKEIKTNTRHLVKKQLTWFNADSRIEWIMADNYDNIYDLVLNILKKTAGQVFNEKN